MDIIILTYSFAAALAISACVVLFFSKSIDEAVALVIPREMSPAWSGYAKFALFTVTFAGGMRLRQLAEFVMMRASAGQAPISAGQGLLEILKTITGSLIAASGILLAFFGVALAVYASARFYQSHRAAVEKAAAQRPRAPERPPIASDRQSVGSERH